MTLSYSEYKQLEYVECSHMEQYDSSFHDFTEDGNKVQDSIKAINEVEKKNSQEHEEQLAKYLQYQKDSTYLKEVLFDLLELEIHSLNVYEKLSGLHRGEKIVFEKGAQKDRAELRTDKIYKEKLYFQAVADLAEKYNIEVTKNPLFDIVALGKEKHKVIFSVVRGKRICDMLEVDLTKLPLVLITIMKFVLPYDFRYLHGLIKKQRAVVEQDLKEAEREQDKDAQSEKFYEYTMSKKHYDYLIQMRYQLDQMRSKLDDAEKRHFLINY